MLIEAKRNETCACSVDYRYCGATPSNNLTQWVDGVGDVVWVGVYSCITVGNMFKRTIVLNLVAFVTSFMLPNNALMLKNTYIQMIAIGYMLCMSFPLDRYKFVK